MKWKAVYTACIGLFLAGIAAALASGWPWLSKLVVSFRLGFLNRYGVVYVVLFASLFFVCRYVFKNKKDDDLPMILAAIGGFFMVIGSFVEPFAVLLGLLLLLGSIFYVYKNSITLKRP